MTSKYKNNEFSTSFKENVRFEISYLKYLGRDCEGWDWEDIVAEGMQASRIKSNTGLSDIYNDCTAWSAKTVKRHNPSTTKKVNLISGRLDINYAECKNLSPDEIGARIINKWNDRVFEAAEKYKDIRTIVLVRANDLSQVVFYEELTEPYNPQDYHWEFNKKGVLNGYIKGTKTKKFAWQYTGTQFTIVSTVPEQKVVIDIADLGSISKEHKRLFMEGVGYR